MAIVWRHIAQSLQGPGHLADGSPCQDSNRVRVFGDESSTTLVACVADGAGSASFSDTGSAIACTTVIENAATFFESNGRFDGLQIDDVLEWCNDARGRIVDEARSRACDCRELATTLCVAIAGPHCSFFFQIGDGAIILGNKGVYGMVFWPQSGEYANSTNFLTSDEYLQRLDFVQVAGRCSDVALMTDGLERLALRFDTQTPHAPFFVPLFRALRATKDVGGLSADLRQFLGSDSVRARSDDDKTLILATRTADDTDYAA